MRALQIALKPGGHLVLGTFAPDGPTKCSGLEVCRYTTTDMLRVFGPDFVLLEERLETHVTPSGGEQRFVFRLFAYLPVGSERDA